MKRQFKRVFCMALSAAMTLMMSAPFAMAKGRAAGSGSTNPPIKTSLPARDWQGEVTFPDWAGYVDDTLAMNSLYSFICFADQGELYVTPDKKTTSFRLFVNNAEIDITSMTAGATYRVDISDLTVDGTNTVQVSAIAPATAKVKVNIPYPTVIEGEPGEVGMDQEIVDMIGDFINAEVKYGFSGAQLAVIKDGKLVINEAWGAANGYRTDSSRILPEDEDYVPVTTDTLYDLASNTKMYSVNYALQYMLSRPKEYDIALEDPITKFFPEFDDEGKTIYKEGTSEELKAQILEWKSQLTIQDILMHQAGFDPDPQYHNDQFNQVTQLPEAGKENLLFSQDRNTTREKVLASPLTYQPGSKTVYSDVDYMLLCFIIEQVAGQGMEEFLREKFWDPMGLTHITYNPLENGFAKDDCAATELDGNHRTDAAGNGQAIRFENCRDGVVQGTVHDEKAYYAMGGISGHAGLFSNAEDLARLCSLMLTGGYEGNMYFTRNVIDQFTKPKSTAYPTWGLGWWRQGDVGRRAYFSTQASENTIGHQGWAGTLTVIDPDEDLVVVCLTNKKNSPIMDNTVDPNDFSSDNYVLGGLGIVTGFVYDAFRSSVEAMDAQIAQMAYNRSAIIYNQHQGTYDETPHLCDALALNDLLVTNAEKRLTATNKSMVQWIYNMNGGWIFDTDNYNIVRKDVDKQLLADVYWDEDSGLNTRVQAVLAGEAAEDARPEMTAELITGGDVPAFFPSNKDFLGGHDQNAVYLPYAYGMNYTSCVGDNSTVWFDGYEGQGTLYFRNIYGEYSNFPGPGKLLRIYVNGHAVDVEPFRSDTDNVYRSCWKVDISDYARNGRNIVQVSGIDRIGNYILMAVENPQVVNGSAGIDPKATRLISDLISSDVEYGFPSAQLAVVKDGKLAYSEAWGQVNAYHSDGTPDTDSPLATTDTLYDLASNTKMYAVNYAIQKLVADGDLTLTTRISQYVDDFAEEGNIAFKTGTSAEEKAEIAGWKSELTIGDILMHQAGFDPDPQFHNDQFNQDTQKPEAGVENTLYAIGKDAVLVAIAKAPLNYKPGTRTVYSDVDYMLLGLIIEKVTGQDLDQYLQNNVYGPLGLSHITYNPLDNGFEADDCAATELNGNTRDGAIDFSGVREGVIQGQVHDEKAWYAMEGVSGHAGLFSNAEDLATLVQAMLHPSGLGEDKLWSRNVKDYFVGPKSLGASNWGQGWWRQGDCQRPWYFGVQASSRTIGHQGWTGTLTMVDPAAKLVVAYLTNKINSPVTDKDSNPNQFDGNWYTASTLGFVPNILYMGLAENSAAADIQPALDALLGDMAIDKLRLVAEEGAVDKEHPIVQSAYAVVDLVMEMAETRVKDENTIALGKVAKALDAGRDAEKLAQVKALLDTLPTPTEKNLAPSTSGSSSGGGSSSVKTEIIQNPDGTTTKKVTNLKTGTVTETTTKKDGTVLTVETKKDGTVTTTEKNPDGSTSKTVQNPDGSSTAEVKTAEGVKAESETTAKGEVTATVTIPEKAADKPVVLPLDEVKEGKNQITVKTDVAAEVVVPVKNAGAGTVAVAVAPDGTEKVIVSSLLTEEGVSLKVDGTTTIRLVDNTKTFLDVEKTHWANEYITFVSAREMLNGTGEGYFSPAQPMTRAMLMTVLARYDGVDTSGGATWYEKGMKWAVAEKVSDGTNPENVITREQLATMLYRYFGSPETKGSLNGFTDKDEVSDFAQTAMRWCVEKEILQGKGDNILAPKDTATRAEVSAMLMRFCRIR